MMKNKLRSQKGFTLSELMVTVVLLLLMTLAAAAALPSTVRAFSTVVDYGESATLSSSLMTAFTGEIRHAQKLQVNSDYTYTFSINRY